MHINVLDKSFLFICSYFLFISFFFTKRTEQKAQCFVPYSAVHCNLFTLHGIQSRLQNNNAEFVKQYRQTLDSFVNTEIAT